MKKLAALLFSIFLMGLYSIQALAATTVTVIAGIPTIYTNTDPTSNQYSSHWEYWSQGASIYLNSGDTSKLRNMPQYGCHVVAQSKLLVEAGLASSDVTVFHPDIYFAWTVANGYQNSSPWEWEIGQAVRAWGALKGTQISLDTVSYSGNPNQVMNYIRDGKYVIMGHERHHAYIGRSASLNANQPIVLDSLGEISCAAYQAVTLKSYDRIDGGTFDTVYVYTVGRIPGTIDVNGCLDGKNSDSLGVYGTFDLYINNVCAVDDVNDFYNKYDSDVIYEIRDIKANPGYEYLGVKSGSITGMVGAGQTAEIRLDFARQGNLFVKGLLDGVIDQSIMGYGTFDVYINGILDEENCTAYNKQWPTGTVYEIKNIQTVDHKNYEEEMSANLTGTIISSTETTAVLVFTTDGTATTEWQTGKVIPGNLDPEMLDIEYQHHYETVSRTSPGADWVQKGVNRTYYENSGSVEEYPYERATSDTYAYVGGYYYHWCGSNNNCNYEMVPGKYETYHGPSELNSFNVVETGTDTNNPLVKYYKLKWKTGEWAGGLATCATGQTAYWYRMYRYQPKVLVTEYNWTKDTDWTDALDTSATSYNVRWRLKGGIALDPEDITEIIAPDSVELFWGESYSLDVEVIPNGIDESVLTYEIADTELFEIDENNILYCKYAGKSTSTTLTISAPNGVTKTVQLIAKIIVENPWQIDIDIPENINPEVLDIQYKHHYEKVAKVSPGEDWVQGSVYRTYYENSGTVQEYPYEQATSATYVYVGGYYYHWCGSNKNCNYERVPGKYETYHGPNDLYAFDVVESGTDTNNPLVKYYKLRWNTGEWSGGLATCATDQTAYWYRMYQYQPKVLITEYIWTKDSDWMDTLDTSATSYSIRWKWKDEILQPGQDPDEPSTGTEWYPLEDIPSAIESIAMCDISEIDSDSDGVVDTYLVNVPDGLSALTLSKTYEGRNVIWSWDSGYNVQPLAALTYSDEYAVISGTDMPPSGAQTVYLPNSVTALDLAGYDISQIRRIRLSDNLSNIPANTFKQAQLEEITIPGSVAQIGEYAFFGCNNLISVTIQPGVVSLGNWAFASCKSLKNVKIGTGMSDVGIFAFSNCSSLENIIIPGSVIEIGEQAFSVCTALSNVVIEEGVAGIGKAAFLGCDSLERVVIPGSVESIGEAAFSVCSNLPNIVIPGSVKDIGRQAFSQCKGLESIEIGEGVMFIGEYAFAGCSNLKDIMVPDSVTNIEAGAFDLCTNLLTITLPAHLEILNPMFADDESLTEITAYSRTMKIDSARSFFADTNLTVLHAYENSTIATYVQEMYPDVQIVYLNEEESEAGCIRLPDMLKQISDEAFCGSTVVNVTMPDGVEYIGSRAFADCVYLCNVYVPSSVSYIADDAFSGSPNVCICAEEGSYAIDYAQRINLHYSYSYLSSR